ncbi:MAG: type II toxin-antitoxin system HicB family antitoxin [Fimbriimonas ginsengisoli]|uniref:Type II toxin-antitoxin system HicB family antitoxin n=1 Tax=Fimbriimonas ginsengisoli TaxID=1005039 RepID=A0A931LVR5_FIMGI|nr:type II toxin-antitoxin system HicB family antitoxin [Fimbriimonas ginsengisoli]
MKITIVLERDSGGWVASAPGLPGCVSQGDTRDEALSNIREAATLYIEDCLASGDPVPSVVDVVVVELPESA